MRAVLLVQLTRKLARATAPAMLKQSLTVARAQEVADSDRGRGGQRNIVERQPEAAAFAGGVAATQRRQHGRLDLAARGKQGLLG